MNTRRFLEPLTLAKVLGVFVFTLWLETVPAHSQSLDRSQPPLVIDSAIVRPGIESNTMLLLLTLRDQSSSPITNITIRVGGENGAIEAVSPLEPNQSRAVELVVDSQTTAPYAIISYDSRGLQHSIARPFDPAPGSPASMRDALASQAPGLIGIAIGALAAFFGTYLAARRNSGATVRAAEINRDSARALARDTAIREQRAELLRGVLGKANHRMTLYAQMIVALASNPNGHEILASVTFGGAQDLTTEKITPAISNEQLRLAIENLIEIDGKCLDKVQRLAGELRNNPSLHETYVAEQLESITQPLGNAILLLNDAAMSYIYGQ